MIQRIPRYRRLAWFVAVPCLLLALILAGQATWDARPLPACLASGLDPLNPVQKCRRLVQLRDSHAAGTTNRNLTLIEQGTVSGVPDLRPAGIAALVALMLYFAICGLGWLVDHRQKPLNG